MQIRSRAVAIALTLIISLASRAEEKPAASLKPIDPQTVAPTAALERARELRKRSDAGDADSTFEFGRLLVYFNVFGPRADPEHASEWRELQGKNPVSYWLQLAAEQGSQKAIDGVCRLGNDRLAPAVLREQGQERCETLRRKFPAR